MRDLCDRARQTTIETAKHPLKKRCGPLPEFRKVTLRAIAESSIQESLCPAHYIGSRVMTHCSRAIVGVLEHPMIIRSLELSMKEKKRQPLIDADGAVGSCGHCMGDSLKRSHTPGQWIYGGSYYAMLCCTLRSHERIPAFSEGDDDQTIRPTHECPSGDQHARTLAPLVSDQCDQVKRARQSALPSHVEPASTNWITRIAAPVKSLWHYLRREYEVGRSIRELSQMDDRMLQDIGIQRFRISSGADEMSKRY
jgi:uncharacterized protein YjiS (DUF1127 family)